MKSEVLRELLLPGAGIDVQVRVNGVLFQVVSVEIEAGGWIPMPGEKVVLNVVRSSASIDPAEPGLVKPE